MTEPDDRNRDAPPSAPVRTMVDEASHVHIARSRAVRLAHTAGMTTARVDTVALVVTELAENLHRHAHGGEIIVLLPGQLAQPPDRLSVIALDRGPGVERFERCYVDGYSTGGTPGCGLGAVRRLSDHFDAVSEPGLGTVVVAGFTVPQTAGTGYVTDSFDVAALGFPLEAHEPNGDRFALARRGTRLLVMLADGLGHGTLAAEASGAAVRQLGGLADHSAGELIAEVDRQLISSRGAAVSVTSLELDVARQGGTLRSAGLGNVGVLTAGPDGRSRRVATAHGTAGTRVSSRRSTASAERSSEFPARGVLVLHTDGLTTRWTLDGRAELLRHTSAVVAAALWRDHARVSDDSMVVVVKALPETVPWPG